MRENDRIKINKQQQEFYDHKSKNLPSRIWSYFRNGSLNRIRKTIGVERDIYELHKRWLGDLRSKKVLDLGCFEGNSLSIYMAQQSQEYLGIDLRPAAYLPKDQCFRDSANEDGLHAALP